MLKDFVRKYETFLLWQNVTFGTMTIFDVLSMVQQTIGIFISVFSLILMYQNHKEKTRLEQEKEKANKGSEESEVHSN